MESNVAYLNNTSSVQIEKEKPFIISSCGYYRVDSGPIIKTERPKGRGDYQLLYILDGKTHFYFDKVERVVSKGEMVLFRPYEPQCYIYYPEDKCQVFWVHFTGNEVDKILDYYNIIRDKKVFYSGALPDYQWLFEQMIRELQLCRTNYKELLTMLLSHILLLANRYMIEGKKTGIDTLNDIEQAIRYFNENYAKDININEYAKSLHISPCWFNRRFKQVTKKTPLQYIISVRLSNAKMLLETKAYNVTETAYAVGFNNPLYFSRLFTKNFNMSPTEYRKRILSYN